MGDASENAELIRRAFDAWAAGTGSFFDLLADDATWTITGSSPLGGTYTSREEFLEGAIRPLGRRLSVPIRPTVRTIVAQRDEVVVLWDGQATAVDGLAYDNTYCWVMRVADGRITDVTAFFDAPRLTDLWERTGALASSAESS